MLRPDEVPNAAELHKMGFKEESKISNLEVSMASNQEMTEWDMMIVNDHPLKEEEALWQMYVMAAKRLNDMLKSRRNGIIVPGR